MIDNKLILTVNNNRTISCRHGDNLFAVLSGAGYIFSGNCGGIGKCRRCLVDIDGIGTVKSCSYTLTENIHVTIAEDKLSVLDSYMKYDDTHSIHHGCSQKIGIAVDLGTTTIAIEQIDMSDGSVMDKLGFMNPQITYGSDVISRIKTGSTVDGLLKLRNCVVTKISSELKEMVSDPADISRIMISGNTTMNAILEQLALDNLGHAPFAIKNPDSVSMSGKEFFDDASFSNAEVTCLPNLSAFVGADALCGAVVCDIDSSDKYQLFADLGTNGELILAKQGIGYASSCACGPAFEGMLRKGVAAPTTAFDLLNRLNMLHIVNDDGVLADQYIERGYRLAGGVTIDMDMIRSFLLAKSAICAGIESLIAMAGITVENISHVYLAGGFGCSLNISSALNLGLFPDSFQDITEFAGNTSLYGAHKCLIDENFIDRIYAFKETLTAVNLGELEGFDKSYYNHMNLRPWIT